MSKSNATVKLTRRTIDALTSTSSRFILWDSDVPGFGVRIESSGLKSFLVRYRVGDGGRGAPRKQMMLGRYGALSPEEARKMARQVLNAVAKGDDPAGDRHKRRKEMTVADVLDRYLVEHVSAHNKPSTATEIRRQVERVLKPAFGRIKISDLSRSHIKQWHTTLAHKPYDANRALAYLRKALSLAANDWELRPDNPAAGIKMFREIARERFFSDAELSKIGDALRDLEDKGGYAPGCFTALRLLALTGMRLGEVLSLRWQQVDFDSGCIWLADAKGGARPVPLGAPVLAYLSELHQAGDYVCEAIDPSKRLHLKTFRRFWSQVRDRSGVENARPHDFRHTAGTYTAQSGANAFVVRDVLGHKSLAMTGRYVSRSIDPLRAATDQFSGRVAAAFSGKQSADVMMVRPHKTAS